MRFCLRTAILPALVVLFLFPGREASALNPQPEVPSKSRTNPKALNPQPEVPSKPKKKKSGKKVKPPASTGR